MKIEHLNTTIQVELVYEKIISAQGDTFIKSLYKSTKGDYYYSNQDLMDFTAKEYTIIPKDVVDLIVKDQ